MASLYRTNTIWLYVQCNVIIRTYSLLDLVAVVLVMFVASIVYDLSAFCQHKYFNDNCFYKQLVINYRYLRQKRRKSHAVAYRRITSFNKYCKYYGTSIGRVVS